MKNYENLAYELKEGVAIIKLNRPDISNALTIALAEELNLCLNSISDDEAVRSVIITGVGKSFSSGGDLKSVKSALDEEKTQEFIGELVKPIYEIALKIRKVPKPIIAAVNGYAMGAGMNLSLSCDLIIASDEAVFCESFINLGLIPGMGGTFFLPRLVGPIKAAELFFTGKPITAKEAKSIGMLNDIVAPDKLMSTAWDWAINLARQPTRAIARTKALLNQTYMNSLEDHLNLEREIQVLTSGDQDCAEGVNSYWDKRMPNFKGK